MRRFGRSHNPKVAGSNPAPATSKKALLRRAFLLSDYATRGPHFRKVPGLSVAGAATVGSPLSPRLAPGVLTSAPEGVDAESRAWLSALRSTGPRAR
jgi:hypothetical protein